VFDGDPFHVEIGHHLIDVQLERIGPGLFDDAGEPKPCFRRAAIEAAITGIGTACLNVDFPEPEGPVSAMNLPRTTSSDTLRHAHVYLTDAARPGQVANANERLAQSSPGLVAHGPYHRRGT